MKLDPHSDSRPSDVDNLLRTGITAVKSKQYEQARELLMQVVELDKKNVLGWLWLSSVVEHPADKEACLENVLLLDPNNQIAHRGLRFIQKQKNAAKNQVALPPDVRPERPNRTTSGRYKRLPPGSKSTSKKSSRSPKRARSPAEKQREKSNSDRDAPIDVFANELLCPSCATLTQPDDKKCRQCRQKLWVSIPRKKQTSKLYKFIVRIQIFNVLVVLFLIGILILIALEDETISSLTLLIVFVVAVLSLLYYLVILIGFIKRWQVIFYLCLFQAILSFSSITAQGVMLGFDSGVGIGCGSVLILMALTQLFLVLNLGDDFTFDKYRILLHTDPDVKTAVNFLARGHFYAKRKMWAMAAIHFRRATYQMSENINCHLALITTYLNLKMYDKIDEPLAKARSLNPDDPMLKKLIKEIKKRRS